MNLEKFFAELKRRKVYSVAIAYVVGGWALTQGIAQVLPVFDIPNWVVRLIVVLIVLGFPVALTLSWFFDLTRYGIVRTPNADVARRIDPAQSANSSERSIAVLPFSDLSPGQDHDYFSDGIAEEILTALAKIDGLHVAARRSSFWFKGRETQLSEIASNLNVRHVVEGSVRRDGNRVRVTAELIDASNGFTLWSEKFEREMHGIFALQDEITRAIVDALKLKLDVSPPPVSRSTDAYDAYLQGLFYVDKSTEEALRKSLEFFQRALDKDPKFSRAWTGIAKAWLWLADAYVPPLEAYPKVRDAARRAHYGSTMMKPRRMFIWRRPNAYWIGISMARKRNSIAQSNLIRTRQRLITSSQRFMPLAVTARKRCLSAAHIQDRSSIIVGEQLCVRTLSLFWPR